MYKKLGLLLTAALIVLAGCTLEVNTSPQILHFIAVPNSGTAPLTVSFTVSATDADGDPLTCTLDYGDGSAAVSFACSSEAYRVHTYQAGTYTALLTVSDGFGGTATSTQTITATAPSQACPSPASLSLSAQALADKEAPEGLAPFEGLAYRPGELLVYQGETALASTDRARLERELDLTPLDVQLSGWAAYRVPAGAERETAAKILELGLGTYVQPNYVYKPLYTPNDEYFVDFQEIQYDLMKLTQSWDLLQSGACKPIVAVIDSGVAYDHPDLDRAIISGYDVSDRDSDPYPDDGDEHGTMIASIIAAETNNGQGMAGATNNLAYIMPLKVFPSGDSLTIANAIGWATSYGAHVLNLSLCITDAEGACSDLTNNPDQAMEYALEDAYRSGVVALAASGNDGNDFVGYPASSPYTIAVGAIDNGKRRAWFSNYGSLLDVVAPGVDVLGAAVPGNGDLYLIENGTSFATPYAAAAASLYLGQYYAVKGTLPSPTQVTNCMRSAAEDLGSNDTGEGLVRADRMLDTGSNFYGCY